MPDQNVTITATANFQQAYNELENLKNELTRISGGGSASGQGAAIAPSDPETPAPPYENRGLTSFSSAPYPSMMTGMGYPFSGVGMGYPLSEQARMASFGPYSAWMGQPYMGAPYGPSGYAARPPTPAPAAEGIAPGGSADPLVHGSVPSAAGTGDSGPVSVAIQSLSSAIQSLSAEIKNLSGSLGRGTGGGAYSGSAASAPPGGGPGAGAPRPPASTGGSAASGVPPPPPDEGAPLPSDQEPNVGGGGRLLSYLFDDSDRGIHTRQNYRARAKAAVPVEFLAGAGGSLLNAWAIQYRTQASIESQQYAGHYVSPIIQEGIHEEANERMWGAIGSGILGTAGSLAHTAGFRMLLPGIAGAAESAGTSVLPGLGLMALGAGLTHAGHAFEVWKDTQGQIAMAKKEGEQTAQYIYGLTGDTHVNEQYVPAHKAIRDFSLHIERVAGGYKSVPETPDQTAMRDAEYQISQALLPLDRGTLPDSVLKQLLPPDTLKTYPHATQAYSNLTQFALSAYGADALPAFQKPDAQKIHNALELMGKFAAAAGDASVVGSLMGSGVPLEKIKAMLATVNQVAGYKQQEALGAAQSGVAAGQVSEMIATGADYSKVIGGLQSEYTGITAQIAAKEAQKKAFQAAGNTLAATQMDQEIASLKAQQAGLAPAGTQIEYSQRSASIQASQIQASIAQTATLYGGGTPEQIQQSILATAGPIRNQAFLDAQLATFGYGLSPADRERLRQQSAQEYQQAEIGVTREANAQYYGNQQGLIGAGGTLAGIGFQQALYSGADSSSLSGLMEGQIGAQQGLYGSLLAQSNSPYLSKLERANYYNQAMQASLQASIMLPRQMAEIAYGQTQAYSGLQSSAAGYLSSYAGLFGGPTASYEAGMQSLLPVQTSLSGAQTRLAAGNLSRQEELTIQQQIVDLKRQELEITERTTRNYLGMMSQVSGTVAGITSTGLSQRLASGGGGPAALGAAQQNEAAAVHAENSAMANYQYYAGKVARREMDPRNQYYLDSIQNLQGATSQRISSQGAYASLGVSSNLAMRQAETGIQATVASSPWATYPNKWAVANQQLGQSIEAIQQLNQEKHAIVTDTQMNPNMKAAQIAQIDQQIQGAVGGAVSAQSSLAYGWTDAIVGSEVNAGGPQGGLGILSRNFNRTVGAIHLEEYTPAFGFAGPGSVAARNKWQFMTGHLANSVGGRYNQPHGILESAMSGVSGVGGLPSSPMIDNGNGDYSTPYIDNLVNQMDTPMSASGAGNQGVLHLSNIERLLAQILNVIQGQGGMNQNMGGGHSGGQTQFSPNQQYGWGRQSWPEGLTSGGQRYNIQNW